MIVVNFSHPLTAEQLAALERLTGQTVTAVRDEPTKSHIDHKRPLAEQVVGLADAIGLTAREWQTTPILVNLPGYAPTAATLLAELHGRMGYFPAVMRLRPEENGALTHFEVAEVIDLRQVRDAARARPAEAE